MVGLRDLGLAIQSGSGGPQGVFSSTPGACIAAAIMNTYKLNTYELKSNTSKSMLLWLPLRKQGLLWRRHVSYSLLRDDRPKAACTHWSAGK